MKPARLLFLALLLLAAPLQAAEQTLENGLRILLRPFKKSDRVALALVFRLGEAHEPEGRSGIAHLTEHLLVTAAAGKTPARTVDEFQARYPIGWNAHTSFDYTIVATVFPGSRLEEELSDAAARLSALRIDEAVFERERARIEQELDAMYEGVPHLVAGNLGREILFPPRAGARRGGTRAALAETSPAEVLERVRRHYQPRNLIVSLAGDLDPERTRALCRASLGALPAGEPPPTATAFPEPAGQPGAREVVLEGEGAPPRGLAAASFVAPRPSAPEYAPFLVSVARLALASQRARCMVMFPPFEDGRILTISSREGREALERFLDGPAREALRAAAQPLDAEIATSWVLGSPAAMTEYEAAFRSAMLSHFAIDPDDLRRRIGAVSAAAIERASPARRGWRERASFVLVKPPAAGD